MSVCQKCRIKYSIEAKLEPLIWIPETNPESDKPFSIFRKNSEKFIDFS